MPRLLDFRHLSAALCVVTALAACAEDGGEAGVPVDPSSLIANPLAALPETLSEVGLYPRAPDLDVVPDVAIRYAPANPLWSSGSLKERFLVVPDGESIDNSGAVWTYPPGTLLFKTFSFYDAAGNLYPVETRVLRRSSEGWDYGAYVWNSDATDATLSDLRRPVAVDVLLDDGTALTHHVPNRLQCRKCHESAPSFVLGLSEIQLGEPDPSGESPLRRFDARGVLAVPPPDDPDRVRHEDPLTEEVLRYFAGNCVHCHNDSEASPSSSYDLGYRAALDNIVGQPTASSVSAAGIRVIPGNPDESILFEAVSHITDEPDIEFMPPVGIDLVDPYVVDLLRRWIESLPDE